jgi:hypothetical protein
MAAFDRINRARLLLERDGFVAQIAALEIERDAALHEIERLNREHADCQGES